MIRIGPIRVSKRGRPLGFKLGAKSSDGGGEVFRCQGAKPLDKPLLAGGGDLVGVRRSG
jgi:hypothetical protein